MKIALIGYGKMGREIEQAANARGHKTGLIIDIQNQEEFSIENLKKNDLAIEFTSPHSAPENIIKCLNAGVPVVTGTTGWKDRFNDVRRVCMENNGALFHASNFSPGVNIMFAVNEFLAKIMDSFPQYDVKMTETHHTQKLDAPSGTAISLADQIIENLLRKKTWTLENTANANEINIQAIREGDVTGIHEVIYQSDIDYISLKHYAKSRKGFAIGAVMAAEYLLNKKGIFTMRDLLGI